MAELYNLIRVCDSVTKLSADAALLGEEGYDIVSITTYKEEIVAAYRISDRPMKTAMSDAMRRGFTDNDGGKEYA